MSSISRTISSSSQSLCIRQDLSLFIPHMFPNITLERIHHVFSSNYIGDVKRVDFVPKTDKQGNIYNSAYIHFNSWCNSITVSNLQARILDPKREARVVYDDPWYWIILQNTAIPKSKPSNYEFKPIKSTCVRSTTMRSSPVPDFFQSENMFDFSEISRRQTTPIEEMEHRVSELEIENAQLRETVEYLKTEMTFNSSSLASANLEKEFQN